MEKRKFTPAEIYGPKNAMGYPEKTYTVSDIEVKPKKKKAPGKYYTQDYLTLR
jgi:hypothetical protein